MYNVYVYVHTHTHIQTYTSIRPWSHASRPLIHMYRLYTHTHTPIYVPKSQNLQTHTYTHAYIHPNNKRT